MSDIVKVDFLGKGGHRGEVAGMIHNSRMDVSSMRPYLDSNGRACITTYTGGDAKKAESYRTQFVSNATLRREEWMALDQAILPVTRDALIGVNDLIANNCVYNLKNAMGTTVLEYHDVTDAMEATMTMDGVNRTPGDRPEFGAHYLPIPIIHADYEINLRELETSRNMGNGLDTFMAEYATRKVAEKLEKLLFTDTSYKFGGGVIYSYVNHPDINLVTLDNQWTNSGVTGKQMLDNVTEMKQASITDKHYGPWILYIPAGYETVLDSDYSDTKGSNTIRERIMKIEGLKAIKVSYTMATNIMLLVQMTTDVVRLVRGLDIQNVEWDAEGKWIKKFKIFTIQVPQIRSDVEGRSGIVKASFSA